LHQILDHGGYSPSFAVVTEGKVAVGKVVRHLSFAPWTILADDRGYIITVLCLVNGRPKAFISYFRKPQAFLSLGLNGILSKRSGGLLRHVWHGPKVMTGMPEA